MWLLYRLLSGAFSPRFSPATRRHPARSLGYLIGLLILTTVLFLLLRHIYAYYLDVINDAINQAQ